MDKKTLSEIKYRKNKGITFLMLIITITFILIITSTIAVSFTSILTSVNQKDFANEINAIQKVVDQYYFKNEKYPVKNNNIVIDLYKMSSEYYSQFSNETITSDKKIILKELDLKEANIDSVSNGLKKGNNLDVYAVSPKTGRVYYAKGKKINKEVYYTLTNKLKESIKLK